MPTLGTNYWGLNPVFRRILIGGPLRYTFSRIRNTINAKNACHRWLSWGCQLYQVPWVFLEPYSCRSGHETVKHLDKFGGLRLKNRWCTIICLITIFTPYVCMIIIKYYRYLFDICNEMGCAQPINSLKTGSQVPMPSSRRFRNPCCSAGVNVNRFAADLFNSGPGICVSWLPAAEASGSPAFLSWICWTSLHLFQPLQVCVEEAGLPRWCGLPQLPLLQMAAKTQGRGKWFHSSDCSSWWTLGSDVGQHPSSTGSYPDGTNFGDADATETWLQV